MRLPKATRLRQYSQLLFVALFLWLLLRTELHRSLRNSGSEIRLPYPVGPFFQTRLARGLLRCLPILIPTMFRGRFFCGWMCPLGLVEPLLQQTEVRAQKRQATAGIESLQTLATTKSYLGWSTHCCPSGYGVVAWLDPFSFLVRSLSLSVVP